MVRVSSVPFLNHSNGLVILLAAQRLVPNHQVSFSEPTRAKLLPSMSAAGLYDHMLLGTVCHPESVRRHRMSRGKQARGRLAVSHFQRWCSRIGAKCPRRLADMRLSPAKYRLPASGKLPEMLSP